MQTTADQYVEGQPPSRSDSAAWLGPALLLGAFALLLTFLSSQSWVVLLYDGLFVGGVILAASGWGQWPVRWLGLSARPAGQQFVVATALGFGILGALTLILGVAALLSPISAWGLLAVGLLSVLVSRWGSADQTRDAEQPDEADPLQRTNRRKRVRQHDADLSPTKLSKSQIAAALVWLPAAIPLAIMIFGATLPPGLLWSDEARGYDVLEYHLQVPREYYDAGRIHFLPHNVYASFPQQVEILYLLLMYLMGGPLQAASAAQLLHAAFGILTVAAVCTWTASPLMRAAAVLLLASVPWLAYVGCLAYVELGVVFFGMVAGLLLLDTLRSGETNVVRTALAAGLCAGLAGGCKYTALAFVTASGGAACFLLLKAFWRQRARFFALYAIGAALAVSPWLIRNAAFTGNPLYPFAYDVFGGEAWSEAQAAQWAAGHEPAMHYAGLTGHAHALWTELLAAPQFGYALWLVPVISLLLCRRRMQLAALLWAFLALACWLLLTHMPGRFGLPLVIPLTLMLVSTETQTTAEPGAAASRKKWLLRAATAMLVIFCVANGLSLWARLRAEDRLWQRTAGVPLAAFAGGAESMPFLNPVTQIIAPGPETRYVWLIGEARVFYVPVPVHYTAVFNRDPWLAFCAAGASPAEAVEWLRSRKVTGLVFSWTEIERLRNTYGFSPLVTPAWVAQLAAAGLQLESAVRDQRGSVLAEYYTIEPG